MSTEKLSKIIVLDFGSQYAHLIAKRFRMLGYYSEIRDPAADTNEFENAVGIVFSGGPSSIYESSAPDFNAEILNLDVPILGLCYGHYVVQKGYGGEVAKADVGEFGFAQLELADTPDDGKKDCPLFEGIKSPMQVWMSHQDGVTKIGEGFSVVGSTRDCKYAALQNLEKRRFSLQFHCEVRDTPDGDKIFENFARYCGMEKNWDSDKVLSTILDDIKTKADEKNVLLFLSGGVDSTVTFALLNEALGQEKVLGLHIDNGFMRKNESARVAELYRNFGFNNFIVEDASEEFLSAIAGLTDPQKKRMAVGETFINVRNKVVAQQNLDEDKWLLAQGTLYPDIIESGGTKNSHTIKTHHNRVAGIQSLIEKGLVIEPLASLYKDEVRVLGKKLGLSDELVMRHPFPGPGLSINVLCSASEANLGGDGLSTNDEKEFYEAKCEITKMEIPHFAKSATEKEIIPIRSVGVQGDFRTYKFPCVLAFRQEDGSFKIPENWSHVEEASSFITNNAQNINRTLIKLYQRYDKIPLYLQKGFCDKERLDQLREVDNIVLTALHKSGWYGKIFQHLTIALPYATRGGRASFVLRPVCSEDVMTARFAQLPHDLIYSIVEDISKLEFVDAIFYDATNKPPATFGWE